MAENKRDYYEVLGVAKDADDNALKHAYRALAKKYHPDMNPGDKEAEAKFKEATEAYAVLSDPEKRKMYDQYGHAAFDGTGGASGFQDFDFSDIFGSMGMGGMGDIFSELFGGGSRSRGSSTRAQKGANLRARVHISFDEAIFGCKKELDISLKEECSSCGGSGAKAGTSPETCHRCGGSGQVTFTQQTMFGTMRNVSACPECSGTGKVIKEKCPDCRGTGYVSKRTKIEVDIPAGIDNGQSIRIREKGEPGYNGGQRGDLLVEVIVGGSDIFERDGEDIYSIQYITFPQAALGGDVRIPTVHGDVIYTVKPGTQTNTRIRLRGKGVPSLRNSLVKGDQYVDLVVKVPTDLPSKAKEALKAYEEAMGGDDPDGGKTTKKRGFRKK